MVGMVIPSMQRSRGAGAVAGHLLVVAGHGGLVDLDHVRPGRLKVAQLGVQDRGHVHGHGGLVAVVFVQGAVNNRHGSGHRHLHGPVRARLGEVQVLHHGRNPPADGTVHPRHLVHLLAPPVQALGHAVHRIHAFHGVQDVVDEVGTALLSVGDEVETGQFLAADGEGGGVVQAFLEEVSLQIKGDRAADGAGQPTGPGKAADGGGGDGW